MKNIKTFGILGSLINIFFIIGISIAIYQNVVSVGPGFSYTGMPALIIYGLLQILGLIGFLWIERKQRLLRGIIWLSAVGSTIIGLVGFMSIGLYLLIGAALMWVGIADLRKMQRGPL